MKGKGKVSGTILEQFWRFLGLFMCVSWGLLGSISAHFSAILGHLRTILGYSGAILGLYWGYLGLFGAILGHHGPSWGHLGTKSVLETYGQKLITVPRYRRPGPFSGPCWEPKTRPILESLDAGSQGSTQHQTRN